MANTKKRPICTIKGCDKPNLAKGYCNKHYKRKMVHGSPYTVLFPKYVGSAKRRLEKRTMPIPECGCLLWIGSLTGGYGHIKYNGRLVLTHRLAWECYVGPIPEGKLVLHKCDTPSCINPNHLYVGNHSDNMRDAYQRGRR